MMMKRMMSVVVFLSFLFVGHAWAHHASGVSGRGYTGPITTVSATPVTKGRLPITIQGEFNNLDSFSDSELRRYAEEGDDVHSIDSFNHVSLGIEYGVTDNLSLGIKIPYVWLNNIREAHSDEPEEIHGLGDSKGIGDILITGQYRFVNLKENSFESSLLFGIKLPTGKTDERNDHGERFETEFQPGSGSWDPLIGVAVTKRFGSVSVDANILYKFATEGSQDTNLGDTFLYNIALSYRASSSAKSAWDLIVEANGEWKEKQTVSGRKDENSGGNIVMLSPGLRFTWDNRLSGYVSVGIPIIQDWNGIQNDFDLRTIAGLSMVF